MVEILKWIFNGACFLGVFESNAMTDDFLRNRLGQIIDLRQLLAVLANHSCGERFYMLGNECIEPSTL